LLRRLRSQHLVLRVVVVCALVGLFTTVERSVAGSAATTPVVAAAITPSGNGSWMVTSTGTVTAAGAATSYGDLTGRHVNAPIVGMASSPDGDGYWLVASDGGVFAFGDAGFFGSTGSLKLNRPIVGMASTPDGHGYWLVASDGGVFAFGDAGFFGSTGSLKLNRPIVGMASTPDGHGYWLVASDGGVFAFGDAGYYGSSGSHPLTSPVVGLAPTQDAHGYWIATASGQVYAFGDASVPVPPQIPALGITTGPSGGYELLTTAGPRSYSAPLSASSALATSTTTGLSSTSGSVTEPQVVRDGSVLREVNPVDPSQYLGGDFRFAGVDAYELNTDWNFNWGCGSPETSTQIDSLFSSLGTHAVVRVWFFQQFAINEHTGVWDWDAMDKLVQAADAYGVHLIATLGNQDGTCDDGVWKDPSWYSSGWKTLDKNWGDDIVSYQQWVQTVVSRYASNPAILAWEPINEPRPETCTLAAGTQGWNCWNNLTCPSEITARDAVRSFFDEVGAEIRAVDPEALISDGALASPGCGYATEADFDYVASSPGIDLVSLHDYTGTTNQSARSLAWYLDEMNTIGKPVFAGENGDYSYYADDPVTCADETAEMAAQSVKAHTELDGFGFVGWLWWNWDTAQAPTSPGPCAPGPDPLLGLVQQLNGT
jgi:aryl-phospho-beta-D-glucosidase BglC (GH1 family)